MTDIEKALADYLGEVCGMRLRPHALTGLAQAAIAAMQPAPQEPVAWMYERAGVRVCMEERRPNYTFPAMGFTEHALGIIPTPPAGGSDAE